MSDNIDEKFFSLLEEYFPEFRLQKKEFDSGEVRYFDLSELRLNLGNITAFFKINNYGTFSKAKEFKDFTSRSYPSFIVTGKDITVNSKQGKAVILNFQDLKIDNLDKDSLKEYILTELNKCFDKKVLSPYETDATVFGDKFFGRSIEIDLITTNVNTNYMIFGSRRSGKTSLLKNLYYIYTNKLYSDIHSSRNYGKALYISCLGVNSLQQFQDSILVELDPTEFWKGRHYKKLFKEAQSQEVAIFRLFTLLANRYKEKVILLLDEIDDMIESKDSESIISFQRKLSTKNFRLIQAGYRAVWRKMQDFNSGYWNFAKPLRLNPFNLTDSRELLTVPMNSLKIKLPSDFEQKVYEETGGIPNYMQQYCSYVVSHVSAHPGKVESSIYNLIYNDPDFDRTVMSSFNQNVREPLEKLICYWLASIGRSRFAITEIEKYIESLSLKTVDFANITQAVNTLVILGILKELGGGDLQYRLVAPIIASLLLKRGFEKKMNLVINELRNLN